MIAIDTCSTRAVLASSPPLSPLEGEDNAARFLPFAKTELAA